MKKILAFLLAFIMIFSLVACGKNEAPIESNIEITEDEHEDSGPIEVDEKLFNVDVTMPATFFEDMSEEAIKTAAEENGFANCLINADGSVTYTMSKAKHKEMLDELKISFEDTIDSLINGEEQVASFVDIKYNDDFSKIDIFVNKALYSSWDSFYVLTFYLAGAYYQSFAGIDADKIDIIVNFIDNATQEIFETASYKEYIANINSEG